MQQNNNKLGLVIDQPLHSNKPRPLYDTFYPGRDPDRNKVRLNLDGPLCT